MLKLINPPRPEAAEHRARTASVEPGKVPRGIHVDAIKGEIELLEGRKGDRAKAEIARLEKHLERVEQHRTPAEVKAARFLNLSSFRKRSKN